VSGDLHVHSTASDGRLAPAVLVAEALRVGLRALAIADHDSVEGLPEAMAAAEGTPLILVPALELSAVAADGRGLHLLGYRIDHDHPVLLERLVTYREGRRERALRMVAALREGGIPITEDEVLAQAGEGAVGRAHVARALEASGVVPTMGDAFRRYIGHDAPFYVPKPQVTLADAIALIRQACGIPVLAHPGISRVDDLLDELVDAGLRGIEVWHAEHSADDVRRYERIAAVRGLLATGGSDYHGPGSSGGGGRLGAATTPDDALDALLLAERG
jgi:predicted metal-dependent phosphoesterase TrpH